MSVRLHSILCWLPLAVACAAVLTAAEVEYQLPDPDAEANNAPAFVLSLGGLTAEQIEQIQKVPGFVRMAQKNGRTEVVWKFWKLGVPWATEEKWIQETEFCLYPFLVLNQKLGNTLWTHGGPAAHDGSIIYPVRAPAGFAFHFNDGATGHNETMGMYGFSPSRPEEIEHEMLRDFVGTPISLEKCGTGYALVSTASRGTMCCWQVNDQFYVRIDNSFDREMVAAYMERLGCITPKDFKIDADRWIQDEIRWRFKSLDAAVQNRIVKKSTRSFLFYTLGHLQSIFPQAPFRTDRDLELRSTVKVEWDGLLLERNWLWANKDNFQYDDYTRGFKLKGPDRYDPEHLPELPPEMRPPPSPTPAQIAACAAPEAAQPFELAFQPPDAPANLPPLTTDQQARLDKVFATLQGRSHTFDQRQECIDSLLMHFSDRPEPERTALLVHLGVRAIEAMPDMDPLVWCVAAETCCREGYPVRNHIERLQHQLAREKDLPPLDQNANHALYYLTRDTRYLPTELALLTAKPNAAGRHLIEACLTANYTTPIVPDILNLLAWNQDREVRATCLRALAILTADGEERLPPFDPAADGKAYTDQLDALRAWWKKAHLQNIDHLAAKHNEPPFISFKVTKVTPNPAPPPKPSVP